MFDLGTVAMTTGIGAVIQFGFYMILRRPLDQVDALQNEIRDLRDKDILGLESEQRSQSDKRNEMYKRIEAVELQYRDKAECIRMHQEMNERIAGYISAVQQIDQVVERTANLVSRTEEISREQISLGRDMSVLSTKIDERTKKFCG